MLDLPELLQKIPQLIARITKFQAFAVYLLDPKREELSIAVLGRLLRKMSPRTLRVKVGRGLVGAAVAGGQADPRQRRARRPALRRSRARLARRARRAAATEGPRHWRAQPAEQHRGAVHREPTKRCCGSSARTSPWPIENARLFEARARVHEHARDAGRNRPRVRRDPPAGRAADPHRQPHQAPHRLPDVRHPAASTKRPASSR